MPIRRLIAVFLLGVFAASCTSNKPQQQQPNFVRDYLKGTSKLVVTGIGPGAVGGSQDDPVQLGFNILSFGIEKPSGEAFHGGQPFVHTAKASWVLPSGPFVATWSPFTAYEKTGDTSPRASIPGVYFADVQYAKPGPFVTVVTGPEGYKGGAATANVFVSTKPAGAIGSKAIAVKTPVAKSKSDLANICTRTPPDPMHAISLDDALRNGKPTVVVFSSPGKSENKLGSLVTDEVLLLDQKYGPKKANFVHVEESPPGSSEPSPAFKAWNLPTEGPWVFVIDKKGVIRGRYEGATTAPMIEKSLKPLL